MNDMSLGRFTQRWPVSTFRHIDSFEERRNLMYAITGITGKVGGAWRARCWPRASPFARSFAMRPRAGSGPSAAAKSPVADMEDAASLTRAFDGAEASSSCRRRSSIPRRAFPRRGPSSTPWTRARRGATGQGGLPVDRRRAGHAVEPAEPAHADGSSARRRCRCPSRSCGPPGSWRTSPGTLRRRASRA